MSVSIVPLEALDRADVLEVIGEAFGRPRSPDWYRWKHEEGPWGRSIGLGALEGGRLLGLRLLLPWGLRIDGVPVRCYRAVEAATRPEAQGRGLFSDLNRELMTMVEAAGPTVLFSTPNENSRRAYRRLGWTWLGPISHRYALVAPLPSRGVIRAEARKAPPFTGTHGTVATGWDESSWRWRTDPRCGHEYTTSWIESSDGTNGLTYRTAMAHRLPCALVLAAWGRPDLVGRAASSAALHLRGPLVLEAAGEGASKPVCQRGSTRGGSLLAVWTSHDEDLGAARRLDCWQTNFADLESVL